MKARTVRRILYYLVSISIAVVTLFPFLAMLLGSFDAQNRYSVSLTSWIPASYTLKNYVSIFQMGSSMMRWIWNSLVISVIPTITGVILAALLGYIFAKKKFRGKNVVFWYFMIALMIPYQATIVSNYLVYNYYNWINQYVVFLVPGLWTVIYMFMMKQNIVTIPDSLLEAAKIDSAGEWRILFEIILPLSVPALSTVAIFSFMNNWNNFMGPLIFTTSEDMYNLIVGLATMNQRTPSFTMQMTAGVVTSIPIVIVYLSLQKYFVDGIVAGGVKG